MIPIDPSTMKVHEDPTATSYHVVNPATRIVENSITCGETFAEQWRASNPHLLLIRADGVGGTGWIYNEDGTFSPPPEEEGSGG